VSKHKGPRVVDLEIDSLGADGFGVAQFERRPVHVKGALPGEVVSARVVRRRHGSWYALPDQWLVRSGAHATPACAAFMRCGGCTMQHLTADAQLALKQQWLLDQLDAAGVVAKMVLPPVRGPQYYYRRRARLAVRSVRDTGELLVGFRESFGNRVARLQSCCVLAEPFSNELPSLAALIAGLDARESIPQIEVAVGDDDAALILRHVEALSAGDLRALAAYQRTTPATVLCQAGGYDTIVGLNGAPARLLHYRLDGFGVALAFHPADFIQVNGPVNADLVATAIAWLGVEPRDRVVDLFCGIGNFTLPLARRGAHALGLEGADELVQRARDNAARNGLTGQLQFETADLYAEPVDSAVRAAFAGVNKVLLDPPRTGAGAVLDLVIAANVERVAYVSCHPVSFARDAARLRKAGFTLTKVRVFDMFPHTTHVETLGVFERPWSS
jgi:23S rRNA (uracil1939-C5)-methyltransferase